MSNYKEVVDSYRIDGHTYCIADEMISKALKKQSKEDYEPCGSSDALSHYVSEHEDGSESYSSYCWSCSQSFTQKHLAQSSLATDFGLDHEGVVLEKKVFEKQPKQEVITKGQTLELFRTTGGTQENGWKTNSAKDYRKLDDETLQFYGFRVELKHDGKVKAMYFPETIDGKLQGYKSRHDPKGFGWNNIGRTGAVNDLSGQNRFPDGAKYCLITGGEFDMVAAQQMLRQYQIQKGQASYDRYAVVSPTTGEGSAAKQCRRFYEWFDKFDVIVIGLDNDEAGENAAEDLSKVLPRDKVRIAKWSGKDPNNMLMEGKEKQFLSNFFGAKEVVDSGVYNANKDMVADVVASLTTPRIPLPPFASKLQEMSKGSLYTKSIYSLIGETSNGKSTFIDAWIFYWMFNLIEHKVGIVSVEATTGEWVAGMLSTYLANNLWWIPQDEIEDYMNTPEVKTKIDNFFYNEYGESRFAIVDDREGTVESLQKCMERLERQYGCTIIVIDVLTDILRVETNEAQAKFFNWQSNFVKNGATVFNVLHTRKTPEDRGGKPTFPDESSVYGNSIFTQKAAGNFIIARNKQVPNGDRIEQNTTYLRVPKLRKGETGAGGAWYYDGETRQVYCRDQYFKDNPDKLPVGYDLSVSSFDKAYWEEGGRGWDGVSDNKGFSKKQKTSTSKVEPDIMDGVL